MDAAKQNALEKHIGACILLCQQIEHLLAILVWHDDPSEHLSEGEFFEKIAASHTKPLEWLRPKVEKKAFCHDIASKLPAVIDRRNELAHRVVISERFHRYVETGDYDFRADIDLFTNMRKLVESKLDEVGMELRELPQEICDAVHSGINDAITKRDEEKRTKRG
jgi:hypothetical protein